jgi:hypothetical protein
MICHWEFKTIEFQDQGPRVHLQGVEKDQMSLATISPELFVKWF